MKKRSFTRWFVPALAAIFLLAFVAGCGGDSKPAAPAATGAGEKVTLKLAQHHFIRNNNGGREDANPRDDATDTTSPSGQPDNECSNLNHRLL